MRLIKCKVFAYITHRQRLLVFRHRHYPEAGIQVPAGTIERDERPERAVLREAFEETGLAKLKLNCFIGEQEHDMSDFGRDEIHHRHFYHLLCTEDPPERWQYEERYSETMPIFEFFWACLPYEVPPLIADHGKMLPQLLERLEIFKH